MENRNALDTFAARLAPVAARAPSLGPPRARECAGVVHEARRRAARTSARGRGANIAT
ncbi:hypothetical protein BE221DRAFT_193108, partial [Ostreococcus tauri]